MPSPLHEALVLLFRSRPALAAELLRACGLPLPEHSRVVLSSETMRNVRPVELAADVMVALEDDERRSLTMIVEVQLRIDEQKRRTWPSYVTLSQRELGCPCVLLVIALDEAVAEWARRPIPLGHPGFVLTPLVIGSDVVPVVMSVEQAARDLELAVLSAVAHGHGERAIDVARPTFHALAGFASLDPDRAGIYLDVVLGALSASARAALEAEMKFKYEYQSDFARRYFAEGKTEGRAEGKAEGAAAGEADALLRVLAARGFVVDAVTEARIRACTDLEVLGRWVTRAVTATSLGQVFDDG